MGAERRRRSGCKTIAAVRAGRKGVRAAALVPRVAQLQLVPGTGGPARSCAPAMLCSCCTAVRYAMLCTLCRYDKLPRDATSVQQLEQEVAQKKMQQDAISIADSERAGRGDTIEIWCGRLFPCRIYTSAVAAAAQF